MPCTSAPASTSSAASRSALGVVFVYWKRPVSVTRPTYSGSAISGVSGTSSSPRMSLTISTVDDASATTRLIAPKRVLSWWWSTLTTRAARASDSVSGPIRRSLAQSTATTARSSSSAGSSRCRSSSARNRYSAGSGASPARYMTTSLPSERSPTVNPESEPRASPSGFSCVTTTKRSCRRRASAAASMSLSVVVTSVLLGKLACELIDQRRHANTALDRFIVFERQLRCPLQRKLAVDPRLQDGVGRLQSRERRPALPFAAQNGYVDRRLAQIRRDADAGHRDETDARILEPADAFGHDRSNRLVDAPHSVGHKARQVSRRPA